MTGLFSDIYWCPAKDGDARVFDLMSRHYSFHPYQDGRRQNLANPNRHLIVGPGEKMVLLGSDCKALFVWRKFIDASGQQGVNCAVFRNEGDQLSSELILKAEQLAAVRWPGERFYTYVGAEQTAKRRGKNNKPGHCFRMAGWRECGKTKHNSLIILEKWTPE